MQAYKRRVIDFCSVFTNKLTHSLKKDKLATKNYEDCMQIHTQKNNIL